VSEYFGQLTATYSTNSPGGGAWDWNYNTTFTCPGSGSRQVEELTIYTRQTSGACNIRLAIFTTSGSLVAEGSAEVALSSTAGWQGHIGTANLTPAGGSAGDPVYLTGGTSYKIVISRDGAIWYYSDVSLGYSDAWHYSDTTEYTGGYPSNLSDPSNQDYGNWAVRIGLVESSAVPVKMDNYLRMMGA